MGIYFANFGPLIIRRRWAQRVKSVSGLLGCMVAGCALLMLSCSVEEDSERPDDPRIACANSVAGCGTALGDRPRGHGGQRGCAVCLRGD